MRQQSPTFLKLTAIYSSNQNRFEKLTQSAKLIIGRKGKC